MKHQVITDPTVLFDARMATKSGIGTHIRGLAEGFLQIRDRGHALPRFLVVGDCGELESDKSLCKLGWPIHFRSQPYSLRALTMFPRNTGAHIAHHLHYNVPVRGRLPYIVTIHDVIHITHPESAGRWPRSAIAGWLLRRAARHAQLILTVSEFSRKEIARELKVRADRIILTPNAVSVNFQPLPRDAAETIRLRCGAPSRYLLAVGIDKPHKNLPFLIRVFARWIRASNTPRDVALLIAGVKAGSPLRADTAALGLGDRVKFQGFIPPADMPAIYQGADALVLPSLVEGFGLPVIEAQRLRVPVIASTAGAVREAAGGGARFFDPQREDELLHALDSLYQNPAETTALVESGAKNESRFRWDATAETVAHAYQSVLTSG